MGDKKKIEEKDLVEAAEAYVAQAMAPYEHLMTPEEKALLSRLPALIVVAELRVAVPD